MWQPVLFLLYRDVSTQHRNDALLLHMEMYMERFGLARFQSEQSGTGVQTVHCAALRLNADKAFCTVAVPQVPLIKIIRNRVKDIVQSGRISHRSEEACDGTSQRISADAEHLFLVAELHLFSRGDMAVVFD